MVDVTAQIDALIAKAVKADKSEDAIRFSQAARNVANAVWADKTARTIEPTATRFTRLSEPIPYMYDGLSAKNASEQAQFICKIAGETGQTILASKHLALLVPIIT